MSFAFHGVLIRTCETEARAMFASIHSHLPLRLILLKDSIYGVYAKGHPTAADELRRIAAFLSEVSGVAFFYWYDNCMESWYQLYENGQLTREQVCGSPDNTWGDGGLFDSIGGDNSLHDIVEEAFLWDHSVVIAENRAELSNAPKSDDQ